MFHGKNLHEIGGAIWNGSGKAARGILDGYKSHLGIPSALWIAGGELPFGPSASAAHNARLDATFVKVEGGVNTGDGVEIAKGDFLVPKTTIVTGENSSVTLQFSDHTKILVRPNSRVKIERLKNGEPRLLTLEYGQIRTIVPESAEEDLESSSKNKLLVRTKSAMVGMKHCDGIVSYFDSTNTTSLEISSGSAKVKKILNGEFNPTLAFKFKEGVQTIGAGSSRSILGDFPSARSTLKVFFLLLPRAQIIGGI